MSRSDWIEFLQQQGATLDAEGSGVLDAPGPAPIELIPLLHQGVLALTGPEGEQFLQGQVTCDLRQLSGDQSLLGSNCTPKGNVISVFRLLKRADEELLLRLPQAILAPALANLKKYIVFSKAEIADAGDRLVGLGVQGPDAEALVTGLVGTLPAGDGAQRVEDGLVAVRVPGNRFELWGEPARLMALWPGFADRAALAPTVSWLRSELAAGLVQQDADSIDLYLPHMLNLQALEGISFTKGCYTGQEVIARLQHRGKLKKLLYRARVDDARPTAGMALHTPDRRSVGRVLAAVPLAEGGYELQAVINKGEADRGELRLEQQDGAPVRLLPLPYPIDPALFERPER